MKPRIVFWYEFASSYSYLSAMRVDDEAARVQVAVDWKPFLLGPIFKSQGWERRRSMSILPKDDTWRATSRE